MLIASTEGEDRERLYDRIRGSDKLFQRVRRKGCGWQCHPAGAMERAHLSRHRG